MWLPQSQAAVPLNLRGGWDSSDQQMDTLKLREAMTLLLTQAIVYSGVCFYLSLQLIWVPQETMVLAVCSYM